MKKTNFVKSIENLTMPEAMKTELFHGCKDKKRTTNLLFRYSRLIATAIICAALLVTVSIPSYAAYDIYQTKNINVFFDKGISQDQIDAIGETLRSIDGVSCVEFVTADEAWNTWSKEYLSEELAASFTENPLADSFNYHVTISLTANTKEIRDQIEQLNGVRHTSDFYELKNQSETE